MCLVWTREPDGDHNGRPIYEYHATEGDRSFHVMWASDRGGMFGFTAVRRPTDRPGMVEYLTKSYGIQWARTLTNCKAECERINREYQNGK